jgi:hypothetical protein
MSQAGAVVFGVAAIVVLAALWFLRHHREQQLRAAQEERIMRSLREVILRENSADPGRSIGSVKKPPLFPALVREVPGLRTESSYPW